MNNSEELGGSPDVASVLKYIAEREANLGKYSDKLRKNAQRIFDIFGSKDYCRKCGKSTRYHGKLRARADNIPAWMPHAADKMPDIYARMATPEDGDLKFDRIENCEIWEQNPDFHEFVPKIDPSIGLKDEVFFKENMGDGDDREWYLELVVDSNEPLQIRSKRSSGKEGEWGISNTPRRVLKALIKSGRLTAFMQDIAYTLKDETEGYKEVAEIAERMAQAIL